MNQIVCFSFYPASSLHIHLNKEYSLIQRKLLGIINVDSDTKGHLLIIYSVFVKYLRKNGNTMRQCISSL